MPKSELHNVERPIMGIICSMSAGGGASCNPGEGLVEFVVPRYVAESARLGEFWILSRRSPDADA